MTKKAVYRHFLLAGHPKIFFFENKNYTSFLTYYEPRYKTQREKNIRRQNGTP